jgi:hypothetical protein
MIVILSSFILLSSATFVIGASKHYTEQSGLTFVNNFTGAIGYNVTAVAQSDSTGIGPGYFISGYSNKGYWYNAGIAYNWSVANTSHNIGFTALFTVLAPNGTVIYAPNIKFTGTVNPNDEVLLNLYFKNGQVIMLIRDWNTSAYAETNFSAEGATKFIGNPNSTSSANGFYTGLTTEWIHLSPYYSSEQPVLYSPFGYPSSPVWLWIDEFCSPSSLCAPKATLFSNYTAGYIMPFSPHILCSVGTAEEYFPSGNFLTGIVCTAPASTTAPTTSIQSQPSSGGGFFQDIFSYIYNFFKSLFLGNNGSNSTTTYNSSTTTIYEQNTTSTNTTTTIGATTSSSTTSTATSTSTTVGTITSTSTKSSSTSTSTTVGTITSLSSTSTTIGTITSTSTIKSASPCDINGTWIGTGTYYGINLFGDQALEINTELVFNLTQNGNNVTGGYLSYPISQTPTAQGIKDEDTGAPDVAGGTGGQLAGTVSGSKLTLYNYGLVYGGRNYIEQWDLDITSCGHMSAGVTNLDNISFTGHTSAADAFALVKQS